MRSCPPQCPRSSTPLNPSPSLFLFLFLFFSSPTNIYAMMHTCIHTCIHAYIHTYMTCTYTHAYMPHTHAFYINRLYLTAALQEARALATYIHQHHEIHAHMCWRTHKKTHTHKCILHVPVVLDSSSAGGSHSSGTHTSTSWNTCIYMLTYTHKHTYTLMHSTCIGCTWQQLCRRLALKWLRMMTHMHNICTKSICVRVLMYVCPPPPICPL